MFGKKPEAKEAIKAEPVNAKPTTVVIKNSDNPQASVSQLKQQEEIIREMFKLINMISEHKNYGFIQRQRDILQNLLDKLAKV